MTPPAPAPHWPARYIGEPWVAGENDCWSFARRVWREVFGLEVPAVDLEHYRPRAIVRALASHPERAHWCALERPCEGAGVLMSTATLPCHVGIWCAADGGGVLHCLEGPGVVYTRPAALTAHGWRVLGYYARRAP